MKKKCIASIFSLASLIFLIYEMYIKTKSGFSTDPVPASSLSLPVWSYCLITTIMVPITIYYLFMNVIFSEKKAS